MSEKLYKATANLQNKNQPHNYVCRNKINYRYTKNHQKKKKKFQLKMQQISKETIINFFNNLQAQKEVFKSVV